MLKPLRSEPLTFWHVSGDIIWRGDGRPTAIERCQADALRDLYAEEARALQIAGAHAEAAVAAKLYRQLTLAVDAHDDWLKLVGRAPVRKAA